MKVYQFSVVVTQDEDGIYIAHVPVLSGCHTQAKTLPALYKRIEEAVQLCLEVEKLKRRSVRQEKFIGVQQLEIAL